jgi:hypothetical protein
MAAAMAGTARRRLRSRSTRLPPTSAAAAPGPGAAAGRRVRRWRRWRSGHRRRGPQPARARPPAAGGRTCGPRPCRAAPWSSGSQAAQVEAVEREHRHQRRKGGRVRRRIRARARCRPISAIGASSFSPQSLKSPATTSSSSRGTSAVDEVGQPLHLAHAAGVHQPEVHHHRVHRLPFQLHRHVQQAALLEAVVADVVVAHVAQRPARQQRVAVLAVARDGIGAVGHLVARRAPGSRPGPGRASRRRCGRSGAHRAVEQPHLLQEHQVGVQRLDGQPRLWISSRLRGPTPRTPLWML